MAMKTVSHQDKKALTSNPYDTEERAAIWSPWHHFPISTFQLGMTAQPTNMENQSLRRIVAYGILPTQDFQRAKCCAEVVDILLIRIRIPTPFSDSTRTCSKPMRAYSRGLKCTACSSSSGPSGWTRNAWLDILAFVTVNAVE